MTTTSTEIVPVDQVADILLNNADLGVVDESMMQADMVRRVLESKDLQDAFADFTSTPADDVEGVLLDVTGVAFVKSAYDEGPAVYGLFQCVHRDSKEKLVVSMGGRTLLASFVWAMRHEAMPITGAFVKEQSRSNSARKYWTFKLAT